LRDVAKILTLGLCYGLTVFGFIRQIEDELRLHYDRAQAEGFFETFFEMFPQIRARHEQAAQEALELDFVRTVTGQRRFLPPLEDDCEPSGYWPSLERRKKILINTPIQGSAANLLIRAVNKFMPRLPLEVEVINLVHDEVDLIVTEPTLVPSIKVVGAGFDAAFRELYGNKLKVKLAFSYGQSWGETKKWEAQP
jgi:DNA polymerase-1